MKRIVNLLYLAGLYAVTGCSHTDGKVLNKQEPLISDSLMKLIRIDTAKYLPVGEELKLSGEVAFDENRVVKVFPNSSGQVVQVPVSFGDYVHKGQLLAIIRSADIAANYSDLDNAQADLKIASRQYENAKSLFESGISSQREFEEAKQNYEKAGAAVNKINAVIRINGGGHTNAGGVYRIVAPADGYIVEKKIMAGAFIRSDMNDNLFTISDLRNVWVWANVYETDIAKLKPGYHAQVSTLAYPGKIFNGEVDKVNDLIDPASKSLRVRITLRNDSLLLKPQMFASIIISNREDRKALSVPSSAIVTDNGKDFVVVYHNNNDVQVRPVSLMMTEGGMAYLQDGLQEGERVISNNQLLLYNSIARK
jgi:cobalt-zinc-cadmium efflux system membrane fusion protein